LPEKAKAARMPVAVPARASTRPVDFAPDQPQADPRAAPAPLRAETATQAAPPGLPSLPPAVLQGPPDAQTPNEAPPPATAAPESSAPLLPDRSEERLVPDFAPLPEEEEAATVVLEPIGLEPGIELPAFPEPKQPDVAYAKTAAIQAREAAVRAHAERKAPEVYAIGVSLLNAADAHVSAGDVEAATDVYRRAEDAFRRAKTRVESQVVSLRLARLVPDGRRGAPRAEIAFGMLDGNTRLDEFAVGERVADGWRLEAVDLATSSITLRRNDEIRRLTATADPAVGPAENLAGGAAGIPESTAPSSAVPGTVVAEVEAVLRDWVRSARDAKLGEHVNFYADVVGPYFTLARVTKEDVRADKLNFLGAYGDIDLEIRNIRVTPKGKDGAVATFDKRWDARQGDRHFAGDERQELTLRKIDGHWRITAEKEVEVYWVRRSWKG
jgi:hypothetical protein